MSNKIIFGLSKCAIAPITATAEDGTPTYGDVIKMPGATELSLDAQGDATKIYADNIVWYSTTANNGYDGSLTLKAIPDEFYTEILGETKDKNGVFIEHSDVQPKEFALMCQFEGDEKAARRVFYRCSTTRPGESSKTKEENIEANDLQINVTAMPRNNDLAVKAKVYAGSAAYDSFFDKVYEPVAADTTSTTSTSGTSSTKSGT